MGSIYREKLLHVNLGIVNHYKINFGKNVCLSVRDNWKTYKQVIKTKHLLMNTFGQGWDIMNGKSVLIRSQCQTTNDGFIKEEPSV